MKWLRKILGLKPKMTEAEIRELGRAMLAPDPLDPHGDGTLREGDSMFEVFEQSLKTGKPVMGSAVFNTDTGEWEIESRVIEEDK